MNFDSKNYKELLIGCGKNWQKKIVHTDRPHDWLNLTTLDNNSQHNPNVVHNLEKLPLPFAEDSFDELHAYEVLEHTGYQGDYEFFFAQFNDFYRILKPNGLLIGTAPNWNNIWAFGDPSHKRIIQKESFYFLDQEAYRQVGKTTMSDFRYLYDGDFKLISSDVDKVCHSFILQIIKPSRKDQILFEQKLIHTLNVAA